MAFQQCGTCGGVYPTTQADGTRYFHACAPVVDPVTRIRGERINKRDDNLRFDATTKTFVPIAVGAGAVTVAAPAPVPEPVVAVAEVNP